MNRYETIYCYFKNNSKEEIDSCLKKLNKEEKELLKLRFSNQLDDRYNRRFYYIISKIKMMLENKNINYSNGKRVTTIYQRLSKYSKEDIDYIISLLPDEDRYILYLRYGNNLNNPDTTNWNNKYRTRFATLINKMESLLKDKSLGKEIRVRTGKILTIYQIFKEYTREEIDKVIESLNDYDKYLLYLRYGKDLNNPNTTNWKSEYKYKFYNYLLPKIKNKLNNIRGIKEVNGIKINSHIKETILEIEYLLTKENNILLDNYKREELLIYILVQKMDGSYNLEDIVNYFEVDRKYILKTVKSVLESLVTTKCLVKR